MRFAHTVRLATGHRSHCKIPMAHPARHRENRHETLPSAGPKMGCRAPENDSAYDRGHPGGRVKNAEAAETYLVELDQESAE